MKPFFSFSAPVNRKNAKEMNGNYDIIKYVCRI